MQYILSFWLEIAYSRLFSGRDRLGLAEYFLTSANHRHRPIPKRRLLACRLSHRPKRENRSSGSTWAYRIKVTTADTLKVKSHKTAISLFHVFGRSDLTELIETRICMSGNLSDIISCLTFQNDILLVTILQVGQLFHFLLTFARAQQRRAACDPVFIMHCCTRIDNSEQCVSVRAESPRQAGFIIIRLLHTAATKAAGYINHKKIRIHKQATKYWLNTENTSMLYKYDYELHYQVSYDHSFINNRLSQLRYQNGNQLYMVESRPNEYSDCHLPLLNFNDPTYNLPQVY